MFSFVWKKALSKSAVFTALALVLLAALAGCGGNDPGSGLVQDIVPAALQGEWDAGSDSYTITGDTLSYGSDFAGTVKHVASLTGEPSGVIVIQYTTAPAGADAGNYSAVYFDKDPSGKILDFATATDYEAEPADAGGWLMYPPVNESDLNTAITNFTTGDYMNKYIYDGTWTAFSPYYRGDYIPPEIEGLNQAVFSDAMYYSFDTAVGGYFADRFTVDSATRSFRYYMDTTSENYWGGTIVKYAPAVTYPAVEPARLIVKVSEVVGDDWWSTPAEVGKYLAYAYKNPAGGIVSASTAHKSEGEKNTGVDTVAEALSEYTAANGYYTYYGTYNTYPEVPATSGIGGTWLGTGDMKAYRVTVSGNTYLEFMDMDDAGNGIYDPDEDEDMAAVCGIIVECSDTSKDSGIMYVQVIEAMAHTPLNFAAVAWRQKTPDGIEIATANDSYSSVEAAKAAYDDPSDYMDANFFTYTK